MLSFFTTAKPFRGHHAIIQRNALKSWTLLDRNVEVILFGDDEGAAEVARTLGIRHEPHVERNAHGTKRLDYMFRRAQEIAGHDLLCYINCDIILMDDFRAALQRVQAAHSQFLMVGRRWDTDIDRALAFHRRDWNTQLRASVIQHAKQRAAEWIDYFVFPRGVYRTDIPAFVVGRVFWDNWLVWKALDAGCPIVDVSRAVVAVHQNHDYGYHPLGRAGVFHGVESGRNYQLAGEWKHLRTIADATEVLGEGGLAPNHARHLAAAKRHLRQAGRLLQHDLWEPAWFSILGLTRPLRHRMGLRARSAKPALGNQQ